MNRRSFIGSALLLPAALGPAKLLAAGPVGKPIVLSGVHIGEIFRDCHFTLASFARVKHCRFFNCEVFIPESSREFEFTYNHLSFGDGYVFKQSGAVIFERPQSIPTRQHVIIGSG